MGALGPLRLTSSQEELLPYHTILVRGVIPLPYLTCTWPTWRRAKLSTVVKTKVDNSKAVAEGQPSKTRLDALPARAA
eukprot:3950857-Pleurochrysis_carterae.AAC.2